MPHKNSNAKIVHKSLWRMRYLVAKGLRQGVHCPHQGSRAVPRLEGRERLAAGRLLAGGRSEDDVPELKPDLGGFCPTSPTLCPTPWRSATPGSSRKTWTLLAILSPQGREQAEQIVEDMQDKWSSLAKEVWVERVKRGDGVGRHEAAIAMAFIPRRTTLQIENMLCEVGCPGSDARWQRPVSSPRVRGARGKSGGSRARSRSWTG